jgi:hypothetical protein
LRCRLGLALRWEFTTLGIENNADRKGGDRETCAEFGGPELGHTGAARLRVEKGLHKEIVAGVQEYAGPNTAGFQAHLGEEKLIPSTITVKHTIEFFVRRASVATTSVMPPRGLAGGNIAQVGL